MRPTLSWLCAFCLVLSFVGTPILVNAQALVTVREGYVLVGARQSAGGQNEVWEITQARFDALADWDPDTYPAPVTRDEAIKIGEAWLKQRNPNVKAWATLNVALLRLTKGGLPTWRWFYRVLLKPEDSPSLAGAAPDAVMVMLLLDGSVVESTFQKAVPVLVSGFKDIYHAGNGVTEPKVVKQVPPHYPPQATRARVAGSVVVECVVNTNGKVGVAKVAQSLDKVYGLDAEAVRTVRQWRFAPATLEGKPVKAVVRVPVAFQLTTKR